MKIIKQKGEGDYSIELLNDTEALKELININKSALMGMFIASIKAYKNALEHNTFLKPNGNSLAYKVILEFGDSEDFEDEEDVEGSSIKEFTL